MQIILLQDRIEKLYKNKAQASFQSRKIKEETFARLKDKQLRIFTVNFWVSEVKKPQTQAGETQGRRNTLNYPTTFML